MKFNKKEITCLQAFATNKKSAIFQQPQVCFYKNKQFSVEKSGKMNKTPRDFSFLPESE